MTHNFFRNYLKNVGIGFRASLVLLIGLIINSLFITIIFGGVIVISGNNLFALLLLLGIILTEFSVYGFLLNHPRFKNFIFRNGVQS